MTMYKFNMQKSIKFNYKTKLVRTSQKLVRKPNRRNIQIKNAMIIYIELN